MAAGTTLKRALWRHGCKPLLVLGWSTALYAQGAPDVMPDWRYSVRPGDTLLDVGQRYLSSPSGWLRVQQLNRIADPRRIPVGTVLRIPANLLRVAPASATLRGLHGTVTWRAQSDQPWQAAQTGQTLAAGAQVQTARDSSVVLVLANSTEILCQPESLLALDTLSAYAGGLMADTRLRLQSGQTEIRTPPESGWQQRLRVITPGAQATVRGTVFRVAASDTQTREETVTGAVALSAAGQQVQVGAAQGTVAASGSPPLPPRPLLAAPDLSMWPTQVQLLPLQLPLPTVAGAATWWAQATDGATPPAVLAQASVSTRNLNFADLPNGELVLRVRAVDGLGLQGLQSEHRIRVLARPFAPLPLGPSGSKVVHAARAPLRWSEPVGAHRYRVQVSGSADFASLMQEVQTAELQWLALADWPVDQALHWRVASIDAQGQQGPWSASASFRYRPAPAQPVLDDHAVRWVAGKIEIELPAPPAFQHYALAVADTAEHLTQAPTALSRDGRAQLAAPPGDSIYLSVRAVSDDDGSMGPAALQRLTLPPPQPRPWWMLLLPLLLLL